METQVLEVAAVPPENGVSAALRETISTIYLGEVMTIWEEQRQLCAGSHDEFAKHLLEVHKAYCLESCRAESPQKAAQLSLCVDPAENVNEAHGESLPEPYDDSTTTRSSVLEENLQQDLLVEESIDSVVDDQAVSLAEKVNDDIGQDETEHVQNEVIECAVVNSAEVDGIDTIPLMCSDCGETFTQMSTFELHIQTPHLNILPQISNDIGIIQQCDISEGENPYACAICVLSFDTLQKFQAHLRSHIEDSANKESLQVISTTEECVEMINEELPQSEDTNSHHTLDIKPLIMADNIDIVDQQIDVSKDTNGESNLESDFDTEVKSTANMRLDMGNITEIGHHVYVCPDCGKAVKSVTGLKIHMMNHNSDRPYVCSNCDKGFSVLTRLKRHELIHTGEKNSECKICAKRFIDSSNLKKHMQSHSKEKPHGCSVCGKRFSFSSHLKRHLKQHKGKHLKTNNGTEVMKLHSSVKPGDENTYTCSLCKLIFQSLSKFQEHLTIHIETAVKNKTPNGSMDSDSVIVKVELQDDGNELNTASIQTHTILKATDDCKLNQDIVTLTGEQQSNSDASVINVKPGRPRKSEPNKPNDNTLLKSHKCPDCVKCFKTTSDLRIHKMTHTEDRPFICPVCDKGFCVLTRLKRHQMIHTGEKPCVCQFCPKRFIDRSSLASHLKSHSTEKPFVCLICNKALAKAYHLTLHMMQHRGDRPFQCTKCPKRFVNMGVLKQHLTTHIIGKPNVCSVCNKGFRSKSQLKMHMMTHTDERPHLCTICGKLFRKMSNLKNHMVTHTGEKPHVCTVCSMRFGLLTTLQTHMKTHSGEKACVCDYCGIGVCTKAYLKIHMRRHTGEKPYACDQCGKTFPRLNDYKMHMRYHTGEKPYKCAQCPAAFNRTDKLQVHIISHTGIMRFVCPICSHKFSMNRYLKRHMKTHAAK